MGFLLGLLNPLGAITKSIAQAYAAKQNAETDQERIQSEQQIKTLEARRDVMVAEARNPGNVIMRGLLALPPAFVIAKILIWDKALGQWTGGHTDSISPDLWHIVMIVYGFYFLDNIVRRVAR